eukprot:gnl/TRDRNA2_/TRDRNA2_43293_c0_seq1.p1 gnl/TRDRNA2_/TRDRNA2_43293_c0~~gnl/TRDRNA2_/TRDRNA2_43293_c0_seq1.p1  ORF type:complete len:501 (-),score=96.03 gnl/TRDRNA2_/TRDRNA2_43293_c0_seq1:115-1617(-)
MSMCVYVCNAPVRKLALLLAFFIWAARSTGICEEDSLSSCHSLIRIITGVMRHNDTEEKRKKRRSAMQKWWEKRKGKKKRRRKRGVRHHQVSKHYVQQQAVHSTSFVPKTGWYKTTDSDEKPDLGIWLEPESFTEVVGTWVATDLDINELYSLWTSVPNSELPNPPEAVPRATGMDMDNINGEQHAELTSISFERGTEIKVTLKWTNMRDGDVIIEMIEMDDNHDTKDKKTKHFTFDPKVTNEKRATELEAELAVDAAKDPGKFQKLFETLAPNCDAIAGTAKTEEEQKEIIESMPDFTEFLGGMKACSKSHHTKGDDDDEDLIDKHATQMASDMTVDGDITIDGDIITKAGSKMSKIRSFVTKVGDIVTKVSDTAYEPLQATSMVGACLAPLLAKGAIVGTAATAGSAVVAAGAITGPPVAAMFSVKLWQRVRKHWDDYDPDHSKAFSAFAEGFLDTSKFAIFDDACKVREKMRKLLEAVKGTPSDAETPPDAETQPEP